MPRQDSVDLSTGLCPSYSRSSLLKQWLWRPRIRFREIAYRIVLITLKWRNNHEKDKCYGIRKICNIRKKIGKLTCLCPFQRSFRKSEPYKSCLSSECPIQKCAKKLRPWLTFTWKGSFTNSTQYSILRDYFLTHFSFANKDIFLSPQDLIEEFFCTFKPQPRHFFYRRFQLVIKKLKLHWIMAHLMWSRCTIMIIVQE